jgi:hypothetical protein
VKEFGRFKGVSMPARLSFPRNPQAISALLLALAGAGFIVFWASQPPQIWPLAREGVGNAGYVTAKTRTGDGGFRVDFRFGLPDGSTHFASETMDQESFDGLKLDQDVWVVYWPRDPGVATILPDRQGREPDWPLFVGTGLWAVAALLWGRMLLRRMA